MYLKQAKIFFTALSLLLFNTSVRADTIESLNKTSLIASDNCIENGRYISREKEDVTIGREFFTSLINFGFDNYVTDIPVAITCSLNSFSNPETFKLSFGIQDYADQGKEEVLVNVYLDGKKVASNTMYSGVGKTILLDIKNIKDIGIEAICTYYERGACPYLHIVEASITSNP